MPVLECLLYALVQLLVAPSGLCRIQVATAEDGAILSVEVERLIDLMEGAQVEVLQKQPGKLTTV
jgi:hypothetical protein